MAKKKKAELKNENLLERKRLKEEQKDESKIQLI